MTLRTYLARRARFAAVFSWVTIALVFALPFRHMPLPKSATTSLVALLSVGLIASVWLAVSAVRCPICRVRYRTFRSTCFTSARSTERFNYCPGCGTNLDSELPPRR
jgi:hypothetical protein